MPDRLQIRRRGRRRGVEGSTIGIDARERRELGRQALLGGDAAHALWHLRHAVEADPDDPRIWQLLGRCFEEIGETKRASMCYAVASRHARLSGHDPEESSVRSLTLGWDRLDPHDA